MTTYKRIDSDRKMIAILRHLADLREPATGKAIANAIDAPHGTVMCHLATLEDEHLVREIGGCWELDMGMALFWARKKAQLAGTVARASEQLLQLEV